MNKKFFEALELLGEENNVDIEVLVEKVKSAMLKAAKKAYPHSEERIRIDIDTKNKKFNMYVVQDIIEDQPIDINEINIAEARRIDPTAYVGGIMHHEIDIAQFGRAAALSAKQSIKGDLRQINKEQLLNRFKDKERECINVQVSQIDPGKKIITVVHEGVELYLFPNEQIPGENLEIGSHIKVYVTSIANKEKKPIIKISRSHKDFVKRLFEIEVPEIYQGIVEVKSIAREAGSRTKIAVCSKDPNVDAVGACIGPKRSRITAVVNELNGEKIDIIPYSENPVEFIAKSLAPAEVIKTVITTKEVVAEEPVEIPETVDEAIIESDENKAEKKDKKDRQPKENKTCTVIVPNNQLSLAIGNRGQNAKLAAKLTGYKIDIKPAYDTVTGEEAPEIKMDTQEKLAEVTEDTDIFTEDAVQADEIIMDDSEDIVSEE